MNNKIDHYAPIKQKATTIDFSFFTLQENIMNILDA